MSRLPSVMKVWSENQFCRICFSSTALIRTPCNCSGSVGFVHRLCLERWMRNVKNFDTCEICRQRYKGLAVPKRTFKKLFKAFFGRPFHALCKFLVLFAITAGLRHIGISAYQFPKVVEFLSIPNGLNEPTAASEILQLLVSAPAVIVQCLMLKWTTESFGKFISSLPCWWNYSWLTVRMSDDEVNAGSDNHGRRESNDDLPIVHLNLSPVA